jgi:hypothetical protein
MTEYALMINVRGVTGHLGGHVLDQGSLVKGVHTGQGESQ